MFKVVWSEKIAGGGRGWIPVPPKEHTKVYASKRDVYADVEIAWEKGYVPRLITDMGNEVCVRVCVTASPRFIGSVYKALKCTFDYSLVEAIKFSKLPKQEQEEYTTELF